MSGSKHAAPSTPRLASRAVRVLVALVAAVSALTMAPGVASPVAAATSPRWGTEAARVIADAKQHFGQLYYSGGHGGWTFSGSSHTGVQQMNVGVDCKNLVQNIFIETGHSNLVSGGNLPTVSYLDKYWKSNGLDREDMSHGTGVYPPVSVVHYKTNPAAIAGAQPGDILIFGDHTQSTTSPKYTDAHAALYVGSETIPGLKNPFPMMIGANPDGASEAPVAFIESGASASPSTVLDTAAPTAAPTDTAAPTATPTDTAAPTDDDGDEPATIAWPAADFDGDDLPVDPSGGVDPAASGWPSWNPWQVTAILHTHLSVASTSNWLPVAPLQPSSARWPGTSIQLGSSTAGTYVPLATPTRLVDTSNGTGTPTKLVSNWPTTFRVTGGPAGSAINIPDTATAITGNITVSGETATGSVYLGPVPTATPSDLPTITFNLGETRTNNVTVALGTNGGSAGRTLSATYVAPWNNTTDLIFDVTGYFLPDQAGYTYVPIARMRLLDTTLGANTNNTVPITNQTAGGATIPTAALGVTGNVTVTSQSAGSVYVGPSAPTDPTKPPTQVLTFGNTGQMVSDGVTVGLDNTGSLDAVYVSTAGATARVTFDVTGYFVRGSGGASYVPMAPTRIADTRSSATLPKLTAGTVDSFSVVGTAGIPTGVVAVTGNCTVTNETGGGELDFGPAPSGDAGPHLITFVAADTRANGATVAVTSRGTLTASLAASGTSSADFVFDVTGYFVVAPTAHNTTFVPVTPFRLVDTRIAKGYAHHLTGKTNNTIPVAGLGGISTHATAVTGNVTVVNATYGYCLYLGPVSLSNPAAPPTSVVNFDAGQVVSDGVTVELGPNGDMNAIYYGPTANTVDFIFDVTGYYVPDPSGATYNPISPVRVVDTRYGIGYGHHLTADSNNMIKIADVVVDGVTIPANATAVTGNVTVVNPTDGYDIYMGPDSLTGTNLSSPPTSVINFGADQVVSGGITVKLRADGMLNTVFNSHGSETTDLVFDVTGYFTNDLSGLTFVPATPSRIVDTRHGIGLPRALLGDTDNSPTNTIGVGGVGNVPGNAKAVTGVVSVVNQTAGYDIYVGPSLTGKNPTTGLTDPKWTPTSPPTSVVNFDKGGVVSGSVAIGLSPLGTVDAVFNSSGSSKTTDLIFDITGYFVPDPISAGAKSLVLSGLQSPLVAGAAGSLTVTAKDLYGDLAPDYTGTIHFSAMDLGVVNGTATLPADYTFTAQDAGTHSFAVTLVTSGSWNVTATDPDKPSISGTDTYLLVNPAALDHITLSPQGASIPAGGSQAYTAKGFDAYGNSRGDVTSATSFSITGAGDHCVVSSCTAVAAGDQTVTATDGVATAAAVLHVSSQVLDHLSLSPSVTTIAMGTSQTYTATGFDVYGNSLGDLTSATTFTVGAGASCAVASCTSLAVGDYAVTATDGTATGAATLHVKGYTYYPIAPIRLVDTRYGIGYSHKLTANANNVIAVADQTVGGVHIPKNATAVTGIATVVTPSAGSALYLGPTILANPATPPTSVLNFTANAVMAGGVTVELSPAGTANAGSMNAIFHSSGTNSTNLVFDVTGYFMPDESGSTYVPITPTRLVDTRYGVGMPKVTLKADKDDHNTVTVWGSVIPATATAVTGTVTVVNATAGYDIYLGPDRPADPTNPPTSVVNFSAGQIISGGVTVKLSSTGTLEAVFNSFGTNTTDFIFDVTGYYTSAPTGLTFVPTTPVRLVDTRTAIGYPHHLTPNANNTIAVAGHSTVPVNAQAITGNATVANATGGYCLYVGPVSLADPTKPPTSVVNFGAGQVLTGAVTVGLSTTGNAVGSLDVIYYSSGGNTTDLIFDVTGYFVP